MNFILFLIFFSDAANATKFSAIQFLYSMADEQRHGNDRYIQKIWQKFNPGIKLVDPKSQLKFTFSQFVRFIINGTLEFEPEVLNHKGWMLWVIRSSYLENFELHLSIGKFIKQ